MASTSRPLVLLVGRWLWLPCLAGFLLAASPATAQPTGTITGTITDTATSLPVAGLPVAVVTVNGSTVFTGLTNATGAYSIQVPQGALYYVVTRPSLDGYISEVYPDVTCLVAFCQSSDIALGTPISVAGGATVSGINISVTRGGSITGAVTNAATGAAVANASVTAWIRIGNSTFGQSASTNASGVYTLVGLQPGTYFLSTSNNAGLRNEIFDGIPCVGGCQSALAVSTGTPTVITGTSTVSGRNFALELGGTLSGVVTNAATGEAVANVQVLAYSKVGTTTVFAGFGTTNAAGEYTIGGLASATYAVHTNATNMTNEIHNNILCPLSCNSNTAVDSGAGVTVTLGAPTAGVNFALDPGGSISGTVVNEVTGAPVQGVGVSALLRVGNSFASRFTSTNASGVYTIAGLPTGSYAIYTSSSAFVNEIFDNIPCPAFCNTTVAGNTGTPVPVVSGSTASGRNFALQPVATGSGTISGTVTDAASGLPIAGINVQIWTVTGTSASSFVSATTSLSGTYTVSGLTAGSYRATTAGNHPYRNEVFDNFPCEGGFCSSSIVLAGTPIAVSAGATATTNFGLSAGDAITGTITDSATGAPLPGVSVFAMQVPSGNFAGSGSSNAFGRFIVRGLPNGTYVLSTSNSLGFHDEIYNDIRCDTFCSTTTALASGTRITLSGAGALAGGDLAELVTGINFALDTRNQAPGAPSNLRIVTTGGTAVFTWTAPSLSQAGAPTSYVLEAGGSPGTTFFRLPIAGTATRLSLPGVPPGRFFVRIRAVNAFGTGLPSNEVILAVGAGGLGLPDAPTNLVAFMSGGLLTMTWTPPLGGGPPSGYVVEAGSATGSANIARLNVTAATFSFSPVPNGFYFLRVRARNAAGVSDPSTEVMINVGNVPAPPGPPSVSHSVSGSTVTINWTPPLQGTPTSYIIEAGSASGLANLARFNTGSTATTQSFSGVPPGTYYLRVRAVNAQGASVASNERIVIVS